MEKIIIYYKNEATIEFVLTNFKDILPSLRQGPEFRKSMAKKFSDFGTVIGVEYNGCIQGFAAFYCNNTYTKKAFISMIAVRRELQGTGVGSVLMDNIETIAWEKGMDSLQLEVSRDNSNAIHFYERRGFLPVELREHSMIIQKSIRGFV